MKKILIITGIMLLTTSIFSVAEANPFQSMPEKATATATTTVTYMTPGTGTTTVAYDSYVDGGGQTLLANKTLLLIQFAGSSTASSLNIYPQYSNNNIDWYQNGGVMTNFSTTSKSFDISTAAYATYSFSSTTQSLGAGISATSTRAFEINSPVRYMRVVITMPIGSQNGAVWAKFAPIREKI